MDEIENPDPQPGTNNWYTEDGYGRARSAHHRSAAVAISNCSDATRPAYRPILDYLASLPQSESEVRSRALLPAEQLQPGLLRGRQQRVHRHQRGQHRFHDSADESSATSRTCLLEHNVSWKYYGDQFNAYLGDKYQINFGAVGAKSDQYCNICNFFQYSTSIMTNDAVRTAVLIDTVDLYTDIQNGTLPAVSFVKPSGWVDGHPASSKWNLLEGFTKKIVDAVKANPSLVEGYRDLHHHGRRRRILRLRIRSAAGFLRRRHAYSAPCRLPLFRGWTRGSTCTTTTFRS